MLLRFAGALLIAIGALAIVIVAFVAAVLLSDTPQFWASAILAALCFFTFRRSRSGRMRMFWWNCGAVLALWALFDGAATLWMGQRGAPIVPRAALWMRLTPFLPGQLTVDDPLLGYRLVPGAHEQDGDVAYDINADGLRAGPPPTPGSTPRGCVLFFGCSFTFGEGVSDQQTFAYLVQAKTGGRFQSRNFGMSGSGPHYALAQVESGMVERAAHCVPTHAIYLVLPHHLVRVAGKFAVHFGPRYALQPDGTARRVGSLNRTRSEFFWDMLRYTSALYVAKNGYNAAADDDDVDLLIALLKTLHQQLLDRYPGIRFDLLYWNDEPMSEMATKLGARLATIGVPLHQLSAVIPEIREPEVGRAYLRGDHHPSAWAHEQVADYIVRNILNGPDS
jgi:hypothetical protein